MININDINIDLKNTAIPLCKNHLILITEHLTLLSIIQVLNLISSWTQAGFLWLTPEATFRDNWYHNNSYQLSSLRQPFFIKL